MSWLVSPSVIFGFASDLSNPIKMKTNTEAAMLSKDDDISWVADNGP